MTAPDEIIAAARLAARGFAARIDRRDAWDTCDDIADEVLEAVLPLIRDAATEAELRRCAELAEEYQATYPYYGAPGRFDAQMPFAPLLRRAAEVAATTAAAEARKARGASMITATIRPVIEVWCEACGEGKLFGLDKANQASRYREQHETWHATCLDCGRPFRQPAPGERCGHAHLGIPPEEDSKEGQR